MASAKPRRAKGSQKTRHPAAKKRIGERSESRLAGLADLAAVDIETPLVADLSGELHALFDPVSNDVLPIYFGPLLGRLYLEGL